MINNAGVMMIQDLTRTGGGHEMQFATKHLGHVDLTVGLRRATVNAMNPGVIATGLQRHVGGQLATPREDQKTVQQGASTSVFAATSALLDGIGGRYLDSNAECEVVDERPADPAMLGGSVASYALDPEGSERLWSLSHEMLR